MNLSCGIIGLPNVGKSTLFNALLEKQVANAANYPFCTIEPNTGIVEVPDKRLPELAKIVGSEKTIPAAIKFVDIAGLVKGAAQGEGLGNQFLSHIQEVHLVIHLLRAFEGDNVAQAGSENPKKDYDVIKTELCLKDLEILERQKEPKGTVDENIKEQWQLIKKIKQKLSSGTTIREMNLSEEDKEFIKDFYLLTSKPELVVLNVSEEDLKKQQNLLDKYSKWQPLVISAELEKELINLSKEERKEYLKSLDLSGSGIERLIQKAYQDLNLISFLTANKKEAHAWTVKKETTAHEAAGIVHSDFQDNFIKAGVTDIEDLIQHNGWKGLKEAGKIHFEGKDYVVQDGDIIQFYHG